MKTSKISFTVLVVLLLIMTTYESCRIAGKDVSFETVFGDFKAGEIEIEIATTVIKDLMQSNPDKSREVIKEICQIIKAYKQVSESYRNTAKSIEGVPNLQPVHDQLETLSEHYGRLAREYENFLLSKNIDCREYIQ